MMILVGDFKFDFYEKNFSLSLINNGVEVYNLILHHYFNSIIGKIERRYLIFGPIHIWINLLIFFRVYLLKPKLVLFWRCTNIHPFTLKIIKKFFKCKIISYNNDDPFPNKDFTINYFQKNQWKMFIKGIKYYDVNFVYRPKNISDYNLLGSKETRILPPYYVNNSVNINTLLPINKRPIDIVFIGHYTKSRLKIIESLLENNLKVEVYGSGWINFLNKKIYPVYGNEYFDLLSKSKIALCFLSELNNDTYTRRNFEIPLCKTVMVSEHSSDLDKLFINGKEYFSFKDLNELIDKLKFLLSNFDIMQETSEHAYNRLISSDYDIDSKVKYFISITKLA